MAKIFINFGHAPNGDPDPGAIGPSGLRESDVNADVGAIAADDLCAAGCEVMTYQSDDLQDICDKANEWGADAVVSIHCNSFSETSTGMEIYTSRGYTRADDLATLIMSQMEGDFPQLPVRADWSDGDVDKEAGLYVLIHTDAPAVLVELAFISNPAEESILGSSNGKRMFASAIARGVTDYLQEME
ncbi:N-acetylmuramoyl-L-alanine amidase AmiC [Sporomusa silvacetica DSM 10669]|uniref:N-acetylmuramoyl-L-alanine amidase AmiC n=1 Tax=Sporomusa silvacetica DSM 10669 TaxID=1123289 RepID=A0ABZ3IGL3_9FIRM|nr:N-acetylmuramoyl-L-alanine amidase [Sporomusa silvacetica]OZC13121.1 N-acetylmuramoyl-L-alanine amidase AmiC precursor [Sporomusa silvacetica DSM 10669]